MRRGGLHPRARDGRGARHASFRRGSSLCRFGMRITFTYEARMQVAKATTRRKEIFEPFNLNAHTLLFA